MKPKSNGFFQRMLYQSIQTKYYHPSNKLSPLTGGGKQHPQFIYGNQRVLTNHIEVLVYPNHNLVKKLNLVLLNYLLTHQRLNQKF